MLTRREALAVIGGATAAGAAAKCAAPTDPTHLYIHQEPDGSLVLDGMSVGAGTPEGTPVSIDSLMNGAMYHKVSHYRIGIFSKKRELAVDNRRRPSWTNSTSYRFVHVDQSQIEPLMPLVLSGQTVKAHFRV